MPVTLPPRSPRDEYPPGASGHDGEIHWAPRRRFGHDDDVKLTEESWRALARSSPWRWRTLHFMRTDSTGSVEAWVRRPGQLLVRDGQGRTTYTAGVPYSSSALTRVVPRRWWRRTTHVSQTPRDRLPHEVQPPLREDGLVAVRPRWGVSYDDPMYNDFQWVAMLDPAELSDHTAV